MADEFVPMIIATNRDLTELHLLVRRGTSHDMYVERDGRFKYFQDVDVDPDPSSGSFVIRRKGRKRATWWLSGRVNDVSQHYLTGGANRPLYILPIESFRYDVVNGKLRSIVRSSRNISVSRLQHLLRLANGLEASFGRGERYAVDRHNNVRQSLVHVDMSITNLRLDTPDDEETRPVYVGYLLRLDHLMNRLNYLKECGYVSLIDKLVPEIHLAICQVLEVAGYHPRPMRPLLTE